MPKVDRRVAADVKALEECHDALRRAQLDAALLESVRRFDKAWRGLKRHDYAAYLQGRCVVGETYDYFGEHAAAEEALAETDASALKKLVSGGAPGGSPAERLRWKREIWALAAKAQTHYRAEAFSSAQELLNLCGEAVDCLASGRKEFFGTRSRLDYARGQIQRQQASFPKARSWFSSSVAWSVKRFVGDTPFADISQPVSKRRALSKADQLAFDHARLLAAWTVGKTQALGLGWIDLTTGSLATSEMHLNAGYAMLRTTGDWIHRAYATLLIGVVQRARAGNNSDGLNKSIDLIQNAKDGLANHPFKLRACYELAQAHLRLGAVQAARKEIDEMMAGLPPNTDAGSQKQRWRCNGLVVKSRIERAARNFPAAQAFAKEARELASQRDQRLDRGWHSEGWIEAQIAQGEVLQDWAATEQGRRVERLTEALECFENARDYCRGNPKTLAVCHFHVARVLARLGDRVRARTAYAHGLTAATVVEHGFVMALAQEIGEEIKDDDCFFISSDLVFLDSTSGLTHHLTTADEAIMNLQSFLARRAEEIAGGKHKGSQRLAVDPRTQRKWVRQTGVAAPQRLRGGVSKVPPR